MSLKFLERCLIRRPHLREAPHRDPSYVCMYSMCVCLSNIMQ